MLPLEARCTLCGMKPLTTRRLQPSGALTATDISLEHMLLSFVGGMIHPGVAFSELWLNARVIWTLTTAGTLTAPETTACKRRIRPCVLLGHGFLFPRRWSGHAAALETRDGGEGQGNATTLGLC